MFWKAIWCISFWRKGMGCSLFCMPPSSFYFHIYRPHKVWHSQPPTKKVTKTSVVLISAEHKMFPSISWFPYYILVIRQSDVDVFERSFNGLNFKASLSFNIWCHVMSNLKPCSMMNLLVYYIVNIQILCAYFRWPASHLMIITVLQYNLSYHFATVPIHGWRRI